MFRKVCDKNNSAYVDSFFLIYLVNYYIIMNFVMVRFYGTFTSVQNKFVCDIFDDVYLHDSKFFHRNKDKLLKQTI